MEEVYGQIVSSDAHLGASDDFLTAITPEIQHEAHLILAFLQVIHDGFVDFQRLGFLLLAFVILGILLFGHDLAGESVLVGLKTNSHIVVVDVVALDVGCRAPAAAAAGIRDALEQISAQEEVVFVETGLEWLRKIAEL